MTTPADRRDVQDIELYWLFRVLQEQYGFSAEAFRQLEALRGFGIKVFAKTEDGRHLPVEHPDLAAALTRARNAYEDDEDTAEPEKVWFSVPVTVSDTEPRAVAIGRLYVNEVSVAEAHARAGAGTYWWPKVKWPRGRVDLGERECTERANSPGIGEIRAPSEVNTKTDAGNKPPVFDRRLERFRKWLEENDTPQVNGIFEIRGKSKDEILDAIRRYPEFALHGKKSNRPIDIQTFHRDFWIKQKIAELASE